MPRGQLYPSEARTFRDEATGVSVRQVTDHPSVHHHPFYYLPAYDDAMRRLVFVSHRTGRPEIFAELRDSGTLQQLTEHEGLADWSVHPSHDGRHVYFTDSVGAWRVECETCREECLVGLEAVAARGAGGVGAAMGTTSLSNDDRYWAVPVKAGVVSRLAIIDTASGSHDVILQRDTIGHPEFHPSDSSLLRYAGTYEDRIWVIGRNGKGNRLVYRRDAAARQWIVHETWRPGTREIITADWPRGCLGIDVDTGAVRRVCSFNAWHPSINRQGTLMCADTTYPDTGLELFDPLDGNGAPRHLCQSGATNQGAHWNTDHCPYDDEDYRKGKWKVYAPQHTHPHPSFSPDGRFVAFTSDRSGHSQVYEVTVGRDSGLEG